MLLLIVVAVVHRQPVSWDGWWKGEREAAWPMVDGVRGDAKAGAVFSFFLVLCRRRRRRCCYSEERRDGRDNEKCIAKADAAAQEWQISPP